MKKSTDGRAAFERRNITLISAAQTYLEYAVTEVSDDVALRNCLEAAIEMLNEAIKLEGKRK